MDKIDLDELERLHAAATPGPWVGRGNHIFCANNKRLVYVEAERALDLQTAAYIVAACNSLPDLIAENRDLRERAQMRQELVEQYEQDIARLRQKVRELEREKVILASHLSKYVMHTMSTKDWLGWAERTAKEAGE